MKDLLSSTMFLPLRMFLSVVYLLITDLRNLFYDVGLFKTYSVNTPVISVGNISVGGSGKTILVQALVDYFLARQMKPAVLSRGYGRSSKGLFLVADEHTIKGNPENSGDESFLIARNHPGLIVVVSEDRVAGAVYLRDNFKPDVIILDDGFQHRRLERDLDIILVDQPMESPGHLLPWGRLRERAESIKRADVVIYSKGGLRDEQADNLILTLDDKLYDCTGNRHTFDSLAGQYGLFAGIGNPEYFFNSVQEIHGSAIKKISFPDHTKYKARQLDIISAISCDYWITTQKDIIKLEPEFCRSHNIYYIGVKTTLPPALLDRLKDYFN